MVRFLRPFAREPDAVEITPFLFVGSAPHRAARAVLRDRGMRLVVDLRAERDGQASWGPDVKVRHVPVVDREAPQPEVLDALTAWIVEAMGQGEPVLVHCHAGIGRAATVVCAVLVRVGYPLPEAYRLVRERRRGVNPTEAQLAALRSFESRMRAGR